MKASTSRRPKRPPVFAIILVSVAVGYALAITIAKAGAPKRTVYELPHDFTLNEATFSSARAHFPSDSVWEKTGRRFAS